MPTALDPRASTTLVGSVREHLAAQAGIIPFDPPVKRILGALEISNDKKDGLRAPTLVVVCLREQAAPNRVPDPDAGGVVQRVTATIGVYVGVPSRNERGGDKWSAGDALDALVAQVRGVLLAWPPQPQPGERMVRFDAFSDPPRTTHRWAPLELRSGGLASLRPGAAWWGDRYETHRLVRGEPLPADPPGAVPSTVYSGLHDAGASPRDRHVRLTGDVAC